MSYRGFTWNLTIGEADCVASLLNRIANEQPMFRVDRHMAKHLLEKADRFREVTTDGSTPTHGPADA